MSEEKNWFPTPLRSQEQGMLLAEVRRRDGDQCRVCRVVVHDGDRKSTTARNFRILNPGTTLTVDGVVVVCRQHLTDGEVRPEPWSPFYRQQTKDWLDEEETPAAPVVETRAAPEFPIELNLYPAARSRELNDVVELIKSLPLLVRMGSGERAVLTIAAKTAQFLDGLLAWTVGVDDEGGLSLTDDQSARDLTPLGLHGRLLVSAGQASCQSALQLLGQRLAADLLVVDAEPLTVDNDLSHETSPSVGAPNSALRYNSNPTEGDLNQDEVAS